MAQLFFWYMTVSFHKNGQSYLLCGHRLTASEREAYAFTGGSVTKWVKQNQEAGNFL